MRQVWIIYLVNQEGRMVQMLSYHRTKKHAESRMRVYENSRQTGVWLRLAPVAA